MRTLVVSPSSLNNSSCMTYYLYEKVLHFQRQHNPTYLDEGTLMHHLLADLYRSKMVTGEKRLHYSQMIEKAIDYGRHKAIGLDLDVTVSEDVVIETFRQYCSYYEHDPLIQTVIGVEKPMSFVLYQEDDISCEEHAIVLPGKDTLVGWTKDCEECKKTEGFRVVLEMIVDLIFENPQGLQIWMDHKTRSRNSEPVPLDNQFMAYAHVSGTRRAFRNNVGYQKTLPAEKKFIRDPFFYTSGVLDWWVGWTVYRAQFIASCVKENHFPPDFTKCRIASAQCTFIDVCMQNPGIDRERFLKENFVNRPRRTIYDGEK